MAVASAVALLAGLGLLWWAGDRAVRYAVELTDLLGISSFMVGFVVMSVSTGLPELLTAVVSVVREAEALSVGNLIGSGLVNLTLVLGVSAVVAGNLVIDRRDEAVLLKVLAVITVLVAGIVATAHLSAVHGVLLLAVYAAVLWLLRRADLIRKVVAEEREEAAVEVQEETVLAGTAGTVVKFLGSLAFVLVGAQLTVDAAVEIGSLLGVPLETLGATVVAIGTGLPELSLELNAVKRREYALAVGDIFGSTLVNLTLILGAFAIVSPVELAVLPLLGTVVYFGIVLVVLWWGMLRHGGIDRRYGYLLIGLFLLYLVEEAGIAAVVYQVV